MFNWQDNKSRLNSVVALSYNSGNGLKVNDIAANVGQGWNLISGGVISRMQVGEPDDQVARHGSGADDDFTKYPSGILYATVPAFNGCPEALTKYPIYGWKNQVYAQHNIVAEDKQLDYFTFQFNGKAGMFVLDPTNLGVAIPLGDTKMKITFQQDANLIAQGVFRTKITSFSIHDVDGLIYKFSVHGSSKVLLSKYCNSNLEQYYSQPKFKGDGVYHQAAFDEGDLPNPYVITGWYLSEIEDALTHRKILYNYETRHINARAGEDLSYNEAKNYTIINHKRSVTKTPAITSVVFPDGHTVTFNYGGQRLDIPTDRVLSSVDVSYQGRYLSKYLLNTSYFILNRYGTPVTDYQRKVARLCLRSVQKIGVDLKEDSPPYIFDYYMGSNAVDDFVPPPFFYAKDIWGFYNGDHSKGYWLEEIDLNTDVSNLSNNRLRGLCFMQDGVSGIYLNPKSGYAKNGLLKQIIYPTGGTLTYEYSQNTGKLDGTNAVTVGGVHVSKTSSTDGSFSNSCNNPISTQYNYVMNGPGSESSLWGLEPPDNSMEQSNRYQPELRKYRWTLHSFPFGECHWRFLYPGILSQQQSVDLLGFQKLMSDLSPVLSIVSIATTIIDVVSLIGGVTGPAAVIIDVISGLVTIALTCFGDQIRNTTTNIYYNFDLNAIAPLPTQFKRVEVIENPGTIGKTIQEFTSSDDYTIWETANPNFTAKQRFAPWAYGLPKLTTVLDAAGNKVKETVNVYNYDYAKRILNWCWTGHPGIPCNSSGLETNLVSCKCLVIKTSSQRSTVWSDVNEYNDTYNTASNSDMKVEFYGMYSGRVHLSQTYERTYKPGYPLQYLQTGTSYVYNYEHNYEPNNISITQSNGDVVYKSIKYTSDYSGGPITTLVQNNIVSLPIASFNRVSKAGLGSYDLGENVTEFTALINGDIKPYRTLERRLTQPSGSALVPYQGPGTDISNYKITRTSAYDAAGNQVGLTDEGGRKITNIYEHNDKFLVASIINADPVVDRPAYTSFETTSFGGWVFNGGSGNYSTANAVTGARSLLLSSYALSATLNSAKPYIVSFWATNSNISVTASATLVKSAPTINGFTYYEYEVPQGNSAVSVSGNSTIDELRLYPKNARMSSTTYDALIGKTTECDANNRITYYEYDNLGRLRFIKDEYRSIVKMYEYNNVSAAKQNGCPGVYYNRLVSEVFTRNNCGAGYLPGRKVYSIAANTYSSTLSQADADAQAENFLLANGQAFANANAICTTLYYNTAQSQNFTTESCAPGYLGGTVAYSVPANRYSSTVSVAEANQMALDEIEANGEAYANSTLHKSCIINYDPEWSWSEGDSSYCSSINGNLPPHHFVKRTDINPNSSSFGQTQWWDAGPQDACPAGNYYSVAQSQVFYKDSCASGTTGAVTYTVAAGTYGSTVSQAAANQLALDDINANGQAYANANGVCVTVCNGSNCTGNNKKCVNGVCEIGVAVEIDCYFEPETQKYAHWYAYWFSNNTYSTYTWYERTPTNCAVE
jgi:hypothetical protein